MGEEAGDIHEKLTFFSCYYVEILYKFIKEDENNDEECDINADDLICT